MLSNVNLLYSAFFSSVWIDTTKISTHNIILQILYDQGIIGLLSYVVMVVYFVNRLSKISNKKNKDEIRLIVSILLYCLGSGLTEASGFFRSPTMYIYFIFIIKLSERYLVNVTNNNNPRYKIKIN